MFDYGMFIGILVLFQKETKQDIANSLANPFQCLRLSLTCKEILRSTQTDIVVLFLEKRLKS